LIWFWSLMKLVKRNIFGKKLAVEDNELIEEKESLY
jgi:hypothetical protein